MPSVISHVKICRLTPISTTTGTINVTVSGGSASAPEYDLNGNTTSDGANYYEWDSLNRLVKIWYGAASVSASTAITYDGLSRWIKMEEKDSSGTTTSSKQFIWDELELCEERDINNDVTRRFYPQGEQIEGASYFYARDHLGSVREMTDSACEVKARYDYDLWGRRVPNLFTGMGAIEADFGFSGHYYHVISQLHFAPYRAYDARIGRWINRDPIGERGGVNLYSYVNNNPWNRIDILGLKPGDSHPSEEAAARAALRDVYDITMSKNPAYGRECGGDIYEKDRKQYLYTNPKLGAINSNDIVIRDETHDKGSRVADYHSHPVGTESRPSDLIDRYGNRIGDISKAMKTGFPQYNVGPDGRMWRANPCGSVDYLGNTNDETY